MLSKKVIGNWCQNSISLSLRWLCNLQNNISTCLSCKGKLANHKNHHFTSFITKTNESIFRKGPKTLFLGALGAFLTPFSENEIFQKNWALSRTIPHGPLTSCTLSEKINESIRRKLNHTSKKPIFALFWTLFAHFLAK